MATPSSNEHQLPLLEVRHLVREFAVRDRSGLKGGVVHAVSDVSFQIFPGETFGVVGETGSGKSTLARSLFQAPPPTSGEVVFRGQDLVKLRRRALLEARRHMQMVFQDPFGSLDPRWRVADLVQEPLDCYQLGTKQSRRRRVAEVLELVGLNEATFGSRKPRQLSGGQCQRVAIARALVLEPDLIVCDEAVSSLDVLIQAQVLNLFEQLREELALSYLFIAHDLSLVKQVSDRVAVMYLGRLCEVGPADEVYRQPLHPYTEGLLASIPEPDPELDRTALPSSIAGEPASPLDPPTGCRFHTRCSYAVPRCATEVPDLRELSPRHSVACHLPLGGKGGHVATATRESDNDL